MKKHLILTILILVLSVFITSCGADMAPDGKPIPDGMKLASDMSRVNYAMFVPEDWLIDLQTNVTMAHVNPGDLTSVQMTSCKLSSDITDLDTWWAQYKQELESAGSVEIVKENEKAVIDGVAAKKVTYKITLTVEFIENGENKVSEKTYKCIVVGVIKNDCIYELLYNSVEDLTAEDGGPFSTNMEAFEEILKNIRLTDKLYPSDKEEIKDENSPSGMKLASNTDIVDYSLYIPDSWIIDNQTGNTLAHVSDSDKSSIQVGQWNFTKNLKDFDTWWVEYKKQLERVSTVVEISELTDTTVNGVAAKKAEYIIKVGSNEYKCLVNAIVRKNSVYVILYTSTLDGYDANTDDVKAIIDNFKFN